MNITPVSANNFGRFGYYGKKGPVLEDVYNGYNRTLRDCDVIYIKDKQGKMHPTTVGNIRALAIQEEHPNYRYMFKDDDIIDKKITDGIISQITAGEIRKGFSKEEEMAYKEGRTPNIITNNPGNKINYLV